jgi:inosine-uridine nucleoside N-ribohydrolase
MGGGLNPQTSDQEFADNPRHEFNYWFDPEAASITLRAPWAKITDTTVDASLQVTPTEQMFARWSRLNTPAARYLTKYTTRPLSSYMWDELAAAAWLDPEIVTSAREVYMDVDTGHGPAYGDTLIWNEIDKPAITVRKVHAQVSVDPARLEKKLTELLSNPAPGETHPMME